MKDSRRDLPPINRLALFAFAVVYFTSVVAGESLYGSLSVPSPFWFPDSILLCALLLSRKDQWWVWILVVWPIRLAAGAPAGTPLWFVMLSVANDSVKGLLAAWWLRRVLPQRIHLTTMREYATFLGIAAAAVPLLSALMAAPARYALGDSLWGAGYRWFLGDAVAQVIVTPALLYWCDGRLRRAGERAVEVALLSGGLLAVLYFAFVMPHASYSPIVLYAPVPFLIWAAARLRPFGTANAIGLVALVSMLSAVRGTGVFAGNSSNQTLLSIQLFLILVAVSSLALAILITGQENRTRELETLLDAAPLPILLATDIDCQSALANRAGHLLHRATIECNRSADAHPRAPRPRLMRDGVSLPAEEFPLRRAARTGETLVGESFTLVLENGSECHLLGNATPLLDEHGTPRGAIGAFLDITELKRAERALRESEERFRLVADAAPMLIWMAGADKLCTFFSRTWLDFTGRALVEELGTGWSAGVHSDDLRRCLDTYWEAFDAREEFEMEYRLRRYDGEFRWIVHRGVPRFEPDGVFCGYIGTCIDMTERKLTERQLQQFSGRLIHAQEEERARIARELHDDISQRLAVLQIRAERFKQSAGRLSPKASHELQSIVELAAQISSDVSNLSHRLHPSTLDTLGLVAALNGLRREFAEQLQVNVHFVHHDMADRVPKDVSTCVFRIVQEALRNVVKHSGVTEATVELSGKDDRVELCVSDAGAGFEPDDLDGKQGLGLISMRERLRRIGGELTIQSAPSAGTRIRVSAPARLPISSPAFRLPESRHELTDHPDEHIRHALGRGLSIEPN